MKLTRVERWMLANQFEILGLLAPERQEEFESAREALRLGYEGEYSHLASHITSDEDVLTVDECEEVNNILNMFRAIDNYIRDSGVPSGMSEDNLQFKGFDGNHDKQYGYTGWLARRNLFQESLPGYAINSHGPTIPTYRRMVRAWEQSENKYKLTEEDIRRIQEAQSP